MVPFKQVLSSLAIVMQIAIGKVGFYIQFEQQEIQEKHRVPQKVWTWFSSKSDLLGVLVANEIVLYMWCSVKMKNPPLLSANGQGSYDAQVAEYLCTCMVLSIHPLEQGTLTPGKSGSMLHILSQSHFLHHLIHLPQPEISLGDLEVGVGQGRSHLLIFLPL
jgi:hypothetical protein